MYTIIPLCIKFKNAYTMYAHKKDYFGVKKCIHFICTLISRFLSLLPADLRPADLRPAYLRPAFPLYISPAGSRQCPFRQKKLLGYTLYVLERQYNFGDIPYIFEDSPTSSESYTSFDEIISWDLHGIFIDCRKFTPNLPFIFFFLFLFFLYFTYFFIYFSISFSDFYLLSLFCIISVCSCVYDNYIMFTELPSMCFKIKK